MRLSNLNRTSKRSSSDLYFVGGAPRSGTTLLQSILCADETVNPLIFEAAPFRFLLEAYMKVKNNFNRFPGVYFNSIEDLNNFYSKHLILFLDNLKQNYSCERLVLKEPELTKSFPLILKLLDGTRFLCIVRDPRAAIASMLVWGDKMRAEGREHFFQNRDMVELSRYYNAFYTPLLKCESTTFQEKIKYIKYEDLVLEPTKIVDEIRDFTGLKLKDFAPNQDWKNTKIDFCDNDLPIRDAVTELYGKPISSSRIATYEQMLTEDEIKTVEKECRLIFKSFEYEKSSK